MALKQQHPYYDGLDRYYRIFMISLIAILLLVLRTTKAEAFSAAATTPTSIRSISSNRPLPSPQFQLRQFSSSKTTLQQRSSRTTATNGEGETGSSSSSSSSSATYKEQQQYYNKDSIEELNNDVGIVLNELRPSNLDPTVPAYFHSRRLTAAYTWSLEEWKIHTNRWRYLRHMKSMFTSRLVQRILPSLSVLLVYTIFILIVGTINDNKPAAAKIAATVESVATAALSGNMNGAVTNSASKKIISTLGTGMHSFLHVPLTPLSLLSTFVAALLTLRSNQGMNRLTEARQAWGNVVLHTRELAILISSYISPKHPQLGLHLARHLSLFGFLFKAHMRGTYEEPTDVVHIMLRQNKQDINYILDNNYNSNNNNSTTTVIDNSTIITPRRSVAPVHILMKLRQGLYSVRDTLSTAEHLMIDNAIMQLDQSVMTCERIRASPIPPVYASHMSRLLLVYLFFLPLALYNSTTLFTASVLNRWIGTILVTMFVGKAMLGIDEISHILEQPFHFMPLLQLSKLSMMDVNQAFQHKPPTTLMPPPLPTE